MRPLHAAFVLTVATLCVAAPHQQRALGQLISKHVWYSARLTPKAIDTDFRPVSLSVSARRSGVNLDNCSRKSECAGTRVCVVTTSDGETVPCSSSSKNCFCFHRNKDDARCTSNRECDEGECCHRFRHELPADRLKCVSASVLSLSCTPTPSSPTPTPARTQIPAPTLNSPTPSSPTPSSPTPSSPTPTPSTSNAPASTSAEESTVCIAVHSLAHLSKDELVFEKAILAHVLCDVNDSCATSGHMVQYKGETMMMRSYCELTGCERKVMRVNSPRYRRGMTVPSRNEDLVFTSFAARYATRAEEGILSVAVKLGL